MLLLKLSLAPALIGLATVAAGRWGARAAGWTASLPLVAGPVLLVVTLQHDAAFGSRAAAAASTGLVSLAVFGVFYAGLAGRLGWWLALPCSWGAFLGTTVVVHAAGVGMAGGLVGVAAFSIAAHHLVRVDQSEGRVDRGPDDLLLRMAAGAVLVVALTGASTRLGATWTGLLAPFPVVVSVLAAFTHVRHGVLATREYLATLLRGLPSFGVFTTSLWVFLPRVRTASATALAVVMALGMHALLLLATEVRGSRRSTVTAAGGAQRRGAAVGTTARSRHSSGTPLSW